jgi:vitamin B12 transporter
MKISRCLICLSSAILFGNLAVAQEETQSLPEVVVTAHRTPSTQAAAGSVISVITSEDLSRKQIRFLADVFREVPGVALSRTGPVGAQTQVRIRGAEANHTLVLIDGVEVNDPSGASEFDFNTLLAEDIDRVELLRGPQSALYGSDAIGGVINIITKRATRSVTAEGFAEAGSLRTGTVAVKTRGSEGALNYSIGFSQFSTEGVSFAPKRQGNTEQDGFDTTVLNAKLGVKPSEKVNLELVTRYVESKLEFDELGDVNGLSLPVDTESETDAEALSLGVKAVFQTFDGNWEHIFGAGLSQIDRENTGGFASTFSGEKQKIYYQTNLFFETSIITDASHVFSLLAENEVDTQDVFGGGIQSDVDSESNGIVAEYRLDLFKQLFFSASFRHDENDLFKDANTARFTGAYVHKATGTRFHGSYGEGIKNPTLFELFGFAPGFTPNPNLQPEKSYGWDAGVEQSIFGGKASLSGTYYSNRIKNLIQGAGATAVNLGGKNRIEGLEFELDAHLLQDLQLNAQYTLTNAEDVNGIQLIRRPKHTASLGAEYTCMDGRMLLGAQASYHGRQDDTAFQAVAPFGSQTVQLDDYILGNVLIKYQLTDTVSLSGRVQNIFDEDYENVFGTGNPGFEAFVGIQVRFGG